VVGAGPGNNDGSIAPRPRRKRPPPALIEQILRQHERAKEHPREFLAWAQCFSADCPEHYRAWVAGFLRRPATDLAAERKRLSRLKNTVFGRQSVLVAPFGGRRGGLCCSAAWATDVWQLEVEYPPGSGHRPSVGEGGSPGQKARSKPFSDAAGGGLSSMLRCPRCRAHVPRDYLTSSGHCQDCRYEAMPQHESTRLQHSASVIDYHGLRSLRRRSV